ncbi:hypothetical protein PIROE2DRAFT_59778 [Piromyces sp. E2]|nr:hypothetical protein PIROE2DRAFT_59778 [Piromyces sp. E2]|eukprot:OUM65799.1 hypothetical protein PIROE2DRAFT_59778 [Piromyces sp. E2]
MTYKCTLNSKNIAEYCKPVTGYFIKSSSIINCTGFNKCQEINSFSVNNCMEGDEGRIGGERIDSYDRYKVCFGTSGVLLPTNIEYYNGGGSSYIAYVTTKYNQEYDKGENEIVVLSISPSDVIVESLQGNEIKYFINQNYQPSDPQSKPLIKCVGSKCEALDKPETSGNNVYYADAYNNKYIITCNDEGCTSEDKCSSIGNNMYQKYFIDNGNNKNIIQCTAKECTVEEAQQGIYIQEKNKAGPIEKLIKCDSNGCTYLDVNNTCASAEDEGNVSSDGISISICTEKEPINGYYMNADNTETSMPYIQCTSKVCEGINIIDESCTKDTVGKLVKESGTIGICLDENKVALFNRYNGNEKKNIISCKGSECSSKTAYYGYYLNGGDDKDTYAIIRCINFHGCSKEIFDKSTCEEAADLIKKDNKYYVCLTSKGDKLKELKKDNTETVTNETVPNSMTISLFNGSYTYNVNKFEMRFVTDGSAFLLTKATLESCVSLTSANECVSAPCQTRCFYTAIDGQYCIGSTDKIIRYTSSTGTDTYSCSVIDNEGFVAENIDSNMRLFFFTEYYEQISTITRGMGNINIVYKCTYSSTGSVPSCEMASGSYIIGDNRIDCTGYRQDYCVVSERYDPTTTVPTTTKNEATNTSGSGSGSGTGTSTGSDSTSKTTSKPSVTTIDDDNKNEGSSGAISLYYKLPSFMMYIILFILGIFIYF